MTTFTYIECDFCKQIAFKGAPLVATAEESRAELKDCGWQVVDGKDKCKFCAKSNPVTQDMFMQQGSASG